MKRGLLKFITCGSVDDGKSTLIGHILYDAKLLYADQERALELESRIGSRGGAVDYSLLLDGLMAEREQGITIDVAYRYFATEARSFIVADTPGHEEYTRNMAVGASFADLAVILVDASRGVLPQTRRHTRICALMGIRYFVFAVNKMDLVGHEKTAFDGIEKEIRRLGEDLALENVRVIPLSATEGDNVTKPSLRMPWYSGEILLECLENVEIEQSGAENGFYLPVQRVCRPDHTFRGFQGQVECGRLRTGDRVTILPSGEKAVVAHIFALNEEAEEVFAGQPATLCLDREVDVSRGCVLEKDAELSVSKAFTVSLLWMDEEPLVPGRDYLVKIGTKTLPGFVSRIRHKVDVNTGAHLPASGAAKNELILCEIALSQAIVVDAFKSHKTLGELLLIDRVSDATAACGVVEVVEGHDELRKTAVFRGENLSAETDFFDEFYYSLRNNAVIRQGAAAKCYELGDPVPLEGESYAYPENFDVLAPKDKAAIQIRGGCVAGVLPLNNYVYAGVPLFDERGFGIRASSPESASAFLKEWTDLAGKAGAPFFNRWIAFDACRRMVFRDDL